MPLADLTLTLDVATRKITAGLDDAAPFVLGDKLRVALDTRIDDVATPLNLRGLRASIGFDLAAPTAGFFSLASHKLDTTPVTISGVAFSANAGEIAAAVAPLGWVTAVVKPENAVWVLTTSRTDAQSAPPAINVAANQLSPSAFVRVRDYKEGGFWRVEIRLAVAPLAFAGLFDLVLAPAPSVRRIRAGVTPAGESDVEINEVQALTLPASFQGTYTLEFDYRSTKPLGIQDTPEAIAAALNAIYTDGKKRFAVTNPESGDAYIEFVGPLKSAPQDLIGVTVRSFAPGKPTFTLDLNTAELASALRAATSIEPMFEIEADLVADGLDPLDDANPARTVTLCREKITVTREQSWSELAVVPAIDWERPPVPRDYVPFTPDQIITGSQFYVGSLGNGVLREFEVDHGKATTALSGIMLTVAATGVVLRLGADFSLTVNDANNVTITLADAIATPPNAGLRLVIGFAGPVSAFQAHTHYFAQLIRNADDPANLNDVLSDILARISAIEVKLPTTPPTVSTGSGAEFTIPLADKTEVLPGAWSASFSPEDAFKTRKGLPALGRGLLPAIHDAAVANAILPLPDPADHAGEVFTNHTSDPIALPGGLGRRGSQIAHAGLFGCDGRVFYPVTRDVVPANTTSYFPTEMERELLMFAVSEKMLRAGGTLDLRFDLSAAMLRANTRAQWLFEIESGVVTQTTSPATTGENIAAISWNPTPLLTARLILSDVLAPATFGVLIKRNALGAFSASQLLYGSFEAAGAVPTNANFVLRARLHQFDTENAATNARGFVFYKLEKASAKFTSPA